MPLLVFVDPEAFFLGWLGSAQRYFQTADALQDLGWDSAIIARRDARNRRTIEAVEKAFLGRVFRTPFGALPRVVDHWGLRYAWSLARRLSGGVSAHEVWAHRLIQWARRWQSEEPLTSADLLCAVTFGRWEVIAAVNTLSQDFGIPYWIDIQDPMKGTTGPGRPTLENEQLHCLREARQIVVTTEAYAEHLRETLPEYAHKIECVRLTHNASALLGEHAAPLEKGLTLMFAGSLYGSPDLSAVPLLRAVALLHERLPLTRGKVTLQLVGRGRGMREAIGQARRLGLGKSLHCLPSVPPEVLRRCVDSADVLCIFMSTTKRLHYQVPGKTYDYLFSNKPILAVTPPGELARIVEETGSGFAVHPEDTERLASILERLLNQKQTTGTVALERNRNKLHPYSFEVFRQKLQGILSECVSASAGSSFEEGTTK